MENKFATIQVSVELGKVVEGEYPSKESVSIESVSIDVPLEMVTNMGVTKFAEVCLLEAYENFKLESVPEDGEVTLTVIVDVNYGQIVEKSQASITMGIAVFKRLGATTSAYTKDFGLLVEHTRQIVMDRFRGTLEVKQLKKKWGAWKKIEDNKENEIKDNIGYPK